MIVIIAFILSLCFSKSQLFVEIIFSNYTDTNFISYLSNFLKQALTDQIALKETLITHCFDELYFSPETQAIIDLTSSLRFENCIKILASQAHLIIINLNPNAEFYNDWQFFSHYSVQNHYRALAALVELLNWDKFVIISEKSSEDFYNNSLELVNKKINFFNFAENESQEHADQLVGKLVKPTGIKNIVILNVGNSAGKLVESLKKKNILNSGCGVILGSKSLWSVMEDGIISYIETDLENSVDAYSYEALAFTKFIKLILEFQNISDPFDLRQFLEKNTENHHLRAKFSIMNIQNHNKAAVGEIYQNLSIINSIIFPGNSTEIPNSPTSNITISMADGVTNPGYANSSYSYPVKFGAKYALSLIKETQFLNGFEILVQHTDCGADVYDSVYSYNCFSKLKNKLGAGLLTTTTAPTCIGNIISLRMLGISIPHISENAPGPALTDKAVYPEFMRVIKDSRYNAGVLFSLLYVFNWKNIIVYYENSSGPIIVYKYLEEMINNTNINIVNSPSERLIKINYRHTDYKQYKPWMLNALNSKIRIYILFVNAPSVFYFIEDFYDTGLRRGDAIFLFYYRIAFSLPSEPDPVQSQKLLELFYGTICVDQEDWVGRYGKQLKEGYIKQYGTDTVYRCFSFDAAMLLLYGIKYTIDQGENVEDSAILNANLRVQKFIGCSGTVSVDPGSNQRSTSIMSIFNLKWNETTNLLYELPAGKYDLGSTQLIQFYDTIIWYDNSTDIPSDIITYHRCPFDESLEEYSKKGAGILYCVSFFVVAVTAGTTFYIWKRWWNAEIPMLTKRSLVKFEDYIAMTMIFIYFLQYLAMGPDLEKYDRYSDWLANYAVINFHWLTKGRIFWVYVYIVIGAVGLWLYFSIHMIFRLEIKFVNWLSVYSTNLAIIFMPLLGNACFLPIVSILISVFQCDQSIGDDLTQSFVRSDCDQFCYKDYHLSIAIISLIALVVYLPLAIYFRPFWDHSNDSANIKTRSLFLMVKSLLQVCIIVLNKTVKVYSQSLHGALYILLFFGFLLFCIKKKPYNYDRCNLWSIVSYCAIIWSVSLSSLFWILPEKMYSLWVALEYIGWGFIIIFGLCLQQKFYPSLLYSEKAPNISIYFRFLLGSKVCASEINQANRERSGKKNFCSENEKLRLKQTTINNDLSISNMPEDLNFHKTESQFAQIQNNNTTDINFSRDLL